MTDAVYEIVCNGIRMETFPDDAGVRDWLLEFDVDVPDVVFETLLPGVPFKIELPRAATPTRLTLKRLKPLPPRDGPPRPRAA